MVPCVHQQGIRDHRYQDISGGICLPAQEMPEMRCQVVHHRDPERIHLERRNEEMSKGCKIDIMDIRKEIKEGNLQVFISIRKIWDREENAIEIGAFIEDTVSKECIRLKTTEVVL